MAQGAEQPVPRRVPRSSKGLDGFSVGGLWYLSYQYTDNANAFAVKRGYIDIKKKVITWGKNSFEARVTPDVTEESGGELKLRLKYIYGKFNWQSAKWEPWLEFGLVHMPWLDFEETSTSTGCRTRCSSSATGRSTRPTRA